MSIRRRLSCGEAVALPPPVGVSHLDISDHESDQKRKKVVRFLTSAASLGGPISTRRVPGGAPEGLGLGGLVGDAVHVGVAAALRRGSRSRGRGGGGVTQRRLAVRGLRRGGVVSRWAWATFSLGAGKETQKS